MFDGRGRRISEAWTTRMSARRAYYSGSDVGVIVVGTLIVGLDDQSTTRHLMMATDVP